MSTDPTQNRPQQRARKFELEDGAEASLDGIAILLRVQLAFRPGIERFSHRRLIDQRNDGQLSGARVAAEIGFVVVAPQALEHWVVVVQDEGLAEKILAVSASQQIVEPHEGGTGKADEG